MPPSPAASRRRALDNDGDLKRAALAASVANVASNTCSRISVSTRGSSSHAYSCYSSDATHRRVGSRHVPRGHDDAAISNEFRLLTHGAAAVSSRQREAAMGSTTNSTAARSFVNTCISTSAIVTAPSRRLEHARHPLYTSMRSDTPTSRRENDAAAFQEYASYFDSSSRGTNVQSYHSQSEVTRENLSQATRRSRKDDLPDFHECSDSSFSSTSDHPLWVMDAEVHHVGPSSIAATSLTTSWHTFQSTGGGSGGASRFSAISGGGSRSGSRVSHSGASSRVSGSSRSRQHAGDDEAQWEETYDDILRVRRADVAVEPQYGGASPLRYNSYGGYEYHQPLYDEYRHYEQRPPPGDRQGISYPPEEAYDDRLYYDGYEPELPLPLSPRPLEDYVEPRYQNRYVVEDPLYSPSETMDESPSLVWDDPTRRPSQRRYITPKSAPPLFDDEEVDQEETPPQPPMLEQMVEITPGVHLALRGCKETLDAVSHDFYTPFTCSVCTLELFGIANAMCVLCPECKCITALEQASDDGEVNAQGPRHGLGLGFDFDSLFQMQAELVAAAVAARGENF